MNRNIKLLIILFTTILLIILGLVLIGSIIYQQNSYRNGPPQNNDQEIMSYPISYNTNNSSSYNDYSGIYLNASVPKDWTITEYTNNAGMQAGTQGSVYAGLTGFEISNGIRIIFSFKGIDGIGGNGVCDTIYKFSDTDPTYVSQLFDDFIEIAKMSDPPNTTDQPKIVDLTSSTYTKIYLFGKEARRVGNDIYWKDEKSSNQYFNPKCGLKSYALNFNPPQFTISNPNTSSLFNEDKYVVKISGEVSDVDFKLLDHVLNSVTIK